jgi:hypothetical protein
MNIQVTVFISLICALQVFALSKDKLHEAVTQLLTDCKEQEGGSTDDFEKLIHGEFAETNTGNCMIACCFETVGIVSNIKERKNY